MNIAIVTWLGCGNFGTALQSYALFRKIKDLGYNAYILQSFNKHFRLKSLLKYFLSKVGFIEWRKKRVINKDYALKKLYSFQEEEYNIINIYTPLQYKHLLRNTDVFVSGSDQIWNAWHIFNPFYFLDFAEGKKRIAYASSIGTSDFPDKYKDQITIFLSRFSHIGVRERTGAEAISALLHRKDIIQVLDPTFLLDPSEWLELSKKAVVELRLPSKYILCYLIGNNSHYVDQVLAVKKAYGIEDVIIIPAIENKTFSVPDITAIYTAAGPKEFVYLIAHATVVCTDSFHATAISINLSVDFVEFLRFSDTDEKSQNSRIYDVLNHFGLCSRLYSSQSKEWMDCIDYKPVQARLADDRTRSINYLVNSIEH